MNNPERDSLLLFAKKFYSLLVIFSIFVISIFSSIYFFGGFSVIEEYSIKRVERKHHAVFKKLNDLIIVGDQSSIQKVEDFVEKNKFARNERGFSFYRSLTLGLIRSLFQNGELEKAERFSYEFVKSNSRDLFMVNLWLYLSQKNKIADTSDKASLRKKFIDEYGSIIQSFDKEVYFFINSFESMKNWHLYFSQNNKQPEFSEKGVIRFPKMSDSQNPLDFYYSGFKLPSSVTFIRVDPRDFSRVKINEVVLLIEKNKHPLKPIDGPRNNVIISDEYIQTNGGSDPYFTFDIRDIVSKYKFSEENINIDLGIKFRKFNE